MIVEDGKERYSSGASQRSQPPEVAESAIVPPGANMLKNFIVLTFLCWSTASFAQQSPSQPESKELEEIFSCMSAGLPSNWKRTWVVVSEKMNESGSRTFEAAFFFSTSTDDMRGRPLEPCDTRRVAEAVYALNKYLPSFEQRQWKEAKLQFGDDGSFNLTYDYTR